MYTFTATLEIIGVNPYVSVPEKILKQLMKEAGREKGPLPICGQVNEKAYRQTLVKYRGAWRLYINTSMLRHSPQRIGERLTISVAYDAIDRSIAMHPALQKALDANAIAGERFKSLSPSRKHEIVRYIASLKTEASVERNIQKAIDFLSGKGRFVGRDAP